MRVTLTPLVSPEVKHIKQVDVRRQRGNACSLGTAHLTSTVFAVLQHTRLQPFLDESYDAPVCYPVLNKPHEPSVDHGVEKSTNVDIAHPVHFTSYDPYCAGIQRVMRAAPRAAAVRKPEEVHLIDGMQDLDEGGLNDLVFSHRHA